MREPHSCPFTGGQLLALGAIAEIRTQESRAPAGARKLAELCYEHARQHPEGPISDVVEVGP